MGLSVGLLVEDPASAPRSAVASYHALVMLRARGVRAPGPIYLDETAPSWARQEL